MASIYLADFVWDGVVHILCTEIQNYLINYKPVGYNKLNMIHIISFTKIHFFILSTSIIGALLFAQFASAQESKPQVTILTEPLVVELVENSMVLQVEVANEGSGAKSFTYGVEVYATETKDNEVLVDVGGDSGIATLGAGEIKTYQLRYSIPAWLKGEYDIFVSLDRSSGERLGKFLVDSIIFNGTTPDIEIINDSCVFTENNETTVLPLKDPVKKYSEGLAISCLVINNTDIEQIVTPTITAYSPNLNGEETVSYRGKETAVLVGDAQKINFTLRSPNTDGTYGVRLSLNTDATSNTVVIANLTNTLKEKELKQAQPHTATPEEQNTALYIIVALLSLTALLAILVYRRKSSLQAPEMEMHNPEN